MGSAGGDDRRAGDGRASVGCCDRREKMGAMDLLPRWKESFAYGYSGLLATGGGLVFGASGGFAFAIDSATGRELWRVFLGGETLAAPISVTVDGHQVILVSGGRALFMFGL